MQFKGNLNDNYTFHLKTTGMRKYNQGLRNCNKKTPKGSKFDIHAQVAGGGHGAWRDGVPLLPPKELA
jgi:hypothetical protein